jgi:predicted ATPase
VGGAIPPFTFENYRSFIEPVALDLSNRVTVIAGQNNTGKSTILRAIALLCNEGAEKLLTAATDFLDQNDTTIRACFTLPTSDSRVQETIQRSHSLIALLNKRNITSLPVGYAISPGQRALDRKRFASDWRSLIPGTDFRNISMELASSSGDANHNLGNIAGMFSRILPINRGTIYLPSVRYISKPGQPPPIYNETPFPGEILRLEQIVSTLRGFDRPAHHQLAEKEKLRRIEDFVGYCIQRTGVSIEVSYDANEILITINGLTLPLKNLGTGFEHLIMIATSALGFGDQIVLLEEPELHLHPTVQKRMMQYLWEKTEATLVVTTHSASVLDSVPANIVHVRQEDNRSKAITVVAAQQHFEAVRDLGYRASDLLQSNFVIWVEGPSDRIYLNAWMRLAASELKEGLDYSILFYGGRLLSHLSFGEEGLAEDLIQALRINRNAAVIIDSDKTTISAQINETKQRIVEEASRLGVLSWITAGREIENYVGATEFKAARSDFPSLPARGGQFKKLVPKTVNKIELSRWLASRPLSLEVLDLHQRIDALVSAIRSASKSERAIPAKPTLPNGTA